MAAFPFISGALRTRKWAIFVATVIAIGIDVGLALGLKVLMLVPLGWCCSSSGSPRPIPRESVSLW
jgi:hypothetical protein